MVSSHGLLGEETLALQILFVDLRGYEEVDACGIEGKLDSRAIFPAQLMEGFLGEGTTVSRLVL
ncbi:MAG: hypothetical protein ACK4QP_00820 [Pseudorhizobium sp.]